MIGLKTSMLKHHGQQLRNWVSTGLVVSVGFFVFLAFVAIRDQQPPFTFWIQDWWRAGGFCTLITLGLGYILLQLQAGGLLGISQLWKTGAWLLLLPFLCMGSCASDTYQASRAMGILGDSSEIVTRTIGKTSGERGAWERSLDGGGDFHTWTEYWLIAERPGFEEWRLPDGSWADGTGIRVSEAIYQSHRVGSTITIVDFPGEAFPSYRLLDQAQAQARSGASGAGVWLVISLVGLYWLRRDLRALRAGVADR